MCFDGNGCKHIDNSKGVEGIKEEVSEGVGGRWMWWRQAAGNIWLEKYFERQADKENDLHLDPDSQVSLLEDIYKINQDIETQTEAMVVSKKSLKK